MDIGKSGRRIVQLEINDKMGLQHDECKVNLETPRINSPTMEIRAVPEARQETLS